jgi:predicted nucleotidyltransferase
MVNEPPARVLTQGVQQGHSVLADAVAAYTRVLGKRLLAAYALGSLAHGGFSPLVSDVDLALILTDPLGKTDSARVKAVAWGLRAKGSTLHKRLSVFWGTPSSLAGWVSGGRFPALDRLDLLEHGLLLRGEELRGGLLPPARNEILVTGAQFALEHLAGSAVGPPRATRGVGLLTKLVPLPARLIPTASGDALEEIRRPKLLLSRGVGRLTKLVLFPARLLFTARTGRVAANDAAVEHYLAANAAPPGASLVATALAWRTVPPENEGAVLSLLEEGMLPLYLHYIDDQRARLASLGRHDLVEAFDQWQGQLLE